MNAWRLHRTVYKTDAGDEDPEYEGSFSNTIPARALEDGRTIVHVDWSKRGWVEVTYLAPVWA